ncbi:MAG: CoA transferase [Deltaproteobacteria bacterium]|jgi:crotonobetainyl-CoA:carnitine CoA-transferase CaiB-like acyl-CoA transferase|nr:CoA transferase [Deltaproteobacteria bacterium]MBW2497384.1 CoA transferase [Deltaproteobacteria bacterium]
MTDRGGALDGLRVLDLGQNVQGPQAAQLLGDLGAEVIKVELPGVGDQGRWTIISPDDPRSPLFIACNRGKRSIALDLRLEAGRDVFLRLIDTADVLISNFTPGTLDRWGLGYEELAARNVRLVYATGSTFGPVGPDADQRGADLAGQAAGGLIARTGPSHPTPIGATLVDHLGSQNMANGILAALYARERSGRGQRVDVSLLGAALFAQAHELTYSFLTGRNPGEVDRGHPLIHALYGVLPTADGHIAIVGVIPEQRSVFFETIGCPQLLEDERFAQPYWPPEIRHELFDRLSETFRTRTTADWAHALRERGIRHAPVRDYTEVMQDEGVYENGYLERFEHPEWGEMVGMGSPIRLGETPAHPGRLAPELGEHTEEILLELGLEWEEITRLREAGAIEDA